jgi:hypothetical protein
VGHRQVDRDREWGRGVWPPQDLAGWASRGHELATWFIKVTYLGFEDSGWNVSGDITIENTGSLAAVITAVDDVLGGVPIDVDCGVGFPYELAVGATLMCSYSEDGMFEGFNEVTVTTERDSYFADAAIIWGDPDPELYKVVNIEDLSDLFGLQALGMLDADDFEPGEYYVFSYDKLFDWGDFAPDACGDHFQYDNTATIVETGQWADATLLVNIRCEILEVEKTVETSFVREHFWDIAKRVETENGFELDGTPKIWLYTDGSGDEMATWIIDVTYEGFVDSDWAVFGSITISNTGQLDAVITDVERRAGTHSDHTDCHGRQIDPRRLWGHLPVHAARGRDVLSAPMTRLWMRQVRGHGQPRDSHDRARRVHGQRPRSSGATRTRRSTRLSRSWTTAPCLARWISVR